MPGREGWGRRAKQPSQTEERKVPKRGLEPRAPRGPLGGLLGWEATAGKAGERERWARSRPCAGLPRTLAGCPCASTPAPAPREEAQSWGEGSCGRQLGVALPARRTKKAKKQSPPGPRGAPREAFWGLDPGPGGSDCATRKVGAGPREPGATSRACQALSGPPGAAARQVALCRDCADLGPPSTGGSSVTVRLFPDGTEAKSQMFPCCPGWDSGWQAALSSCWLGRWSRSGPWPSPADGGWWGGQGGQRGLVRVGTLRSSPLCRLPGLRAPSWLWETSGPDLAELADTSSFLL